MLFFIYLANKEKHFFIDKVPYLLTGKYGFFISVRQVSYFL